MFKFAVRFKDGLLKDVNWWPNLMARDPGDRVLPWSTMPFSFYLKTILRKAVGIPEENWKAKALVFLQEYCYDYKDRQKYVQAMALLIASDNDTLSEIEKYLENIHDYNFGEYDPD